LKVVIAPDSFKGSMTSIETINIIGSTLKEYFPKADIKGIPIADGGEGTVKAMTYALGGELIQKDVLNPLGESITSYYGKVGHLGIIEMANCSGITLIKHLNPLKTSTYGTGQMIKHALNDGCTHLLIGIGGSATNDGGTGALEALGVRFIDIHHEVINDMCGEKLSKIRYIDASALDSRLKDVDVKVMCDVDNPLTGERGATYVYGPQKGADRDALRKLESGMMNYSEQLIHYFEKDYGKLPGAGAAGGLGVALSSFLKAELKSGIDIILDTAKFNELIDGADFVVTGEGRLDGQSIQGKVIDGITNRTKVKNIPVVVIAGGVAEGYEAVFDNGVDVLITLPNKPMSLEDAMNKSKDLLREKMHQFCNSLKIGMKISGQ